MKTLVFYLYTPLTLFYKTTSTIKFKLLYTDTDSFVIHLFVVNLAKNIISCPYLWDVFDFREINNKHLYNLGRGNADLHAGEVGYFNNETTVNLSVEVFGLRPQMYSFTLCDASEYIQGINYLMDVQLKAVANGIARSQIERFKHENYVRMFNSGAITNVVNRRIISKLHQVRLIITIWICITGHLTICFQVYTTKQEKRRCCA